MAVTQTEESKFPEIRCFDSDSNPIKSEETPSSLPSDQTDTIIIHAPLNILEEEPRRALIFRCPEDR